VPETANPTILLGQVIAGSGAAPLADGAVVVEGDQIAWVGAERDLPDGYTSRAPRRMGGPGHTVMPGLVDAHIHIAFGEARSEEEVALYSSVEYRALKAAWFARKVLRAGVTSAFDAATTFNVAAAVRDAIEAGMYEGPRMAVCGPQLTTYQGLEASFPAWAPWPPGQAGVLVQSRDEISAVVRKQVKDGVDCIKVSGSSDVPHNTNPIDGVAFSQAEFDLIAEEAHRLNRKCAVHARSRDAVLYAARAGFDYIMHASYIDDAGIEACLKAGSIVVPTLTLLANAIDPNAKRKAAVAYYSREYEAAATNLRRAFDAGVPLAAGSESGWSTVPFGEWHGLEMQIFVEHLGLTPAQAIAAGTSVGARLLPRFQDSVGVLAAGKFADILLLDGDPLSDITVVQQPSRRKAVIKAGEVVDITSVIPPRKIYGYEKSQNYLQGRFLYDEARRAGVFEPS